VTIQVRPWIGLEDLADEDPSGVLCPLPDSISEVAAESAIEIASAVLYEVTGRRWSGLGSVVVRPVAEDTSTKFLVPGWNESWGSYDSSLGSCIPTDTLDLGFFPVVEISRVRVNGAVVPASNYQLQQRRFLVRVDGGTWPCDQDISLPPTAPDTFAVDIVHGIEPPEAGKHACSVYAAELAKSFCNLDCALPQRTQYMTRQGVSTILMDPLNVIERGMIGLPTVDAWVRAVNPHQRRKRAQIVSNKSVPEEECSPPLSAVRLGVDYYAYPRRNINRFCG
jgi:hypothetical protein